MRVIIVVNFLALPRDDCGSGGVLNSGVFGYVLCAFYIILFNFMNISQTYESKTPKRFNITHVLMQWRNNNQSFLQI